MTEVNVGSRWRDKKNPRAPIYEVTAVNAEYVWYRPIDCACEFRPIDVEYFLFMYEPAEDD